MEFTWKFIDRIICDNKIYKSGVEIMEFTLYCFAKTFYLPYSGEPKYKNSLHLGNFFNCENGADSFFKLTRGETSGNKWINRISLNLEVCGAIQDEIVQYVYRKVIKQSTGTLKKEQLLEILLRQHRIYRYQANRI